MARWKMLMEVTLLYIALPLVYFLGWVPVPKIPVLLLAAAYCGYRLWEDPSFGRGILFRRASGDISRTILLRTIAVTVTIILLIWMIQPDRFFAFPSHRPFLWFVIMLLYPLLSALPQEFIYRTYFFHKFEDYIGSEKLTIVASAVLFAFLHIVYDNWWAVVMSFVAGMLFGLTYARTKSLFWVSVEHTIYGWLVFTLGMGNYFYEGF